MVAKSSNKSILVPVDFSAHSEAALLKACELAECTKQKIIVLHVVHDPGEMPGYYAKVTKKKMLVRMEDAAKEMLDEFIEQAAEKHPDIKGLKHLETMLILGLPVTRILQVIEKKQPSMVVMGSQGRTGLSHLLIGSKAEQLVRLCPVPVTIVKA
ncbi:MAG: universal stress protein [Gammaproteobacteria bacterium]|nr:universal stress protein [Gammaproteobacteria bacterium]